MEREISENNMKKIKIEKVLEMTQNEVVLWGASQCCRMLLLLLKFHSNITVKVVFDNDVKKHCNGYFDNTDCVAPYLISDSIPVLICTQKESNCGQIIEQCKELGYNNVFCVDIEAMKLYVENLSDKEFLEVKFCLSLNKTKLDLANPRTFNEKLQWLKLFDRNTRYTKLVDKYEVKDFVGNTIGPQYVIPTLGVWNTADEIDFDSLPEKYVLKCTHDSGGVYICTNKANENETEIKLKLNNALQKNFYYAGREFPYKDIRPRVIAEPYLIDHKTNELRDYKFFTFNSEVKAMFIASDRQAESETKFDFFDRKFNHLDCLNKHPNAKVLPEKPEQYEKMIEFAEKLSKGIPHVRVDFYEVDGKVYFGEMTFYHWSGFKPFKPEKWDYIFGDWLDLPR